MLFNSLQFGVFFLIVYSLYLILRHNRQWQNWLLLLASVYFYACWDWRFLFLIFITITNDFLCAGAIDKSSDRNKRKFYLIVSLCVNLAILGFFKYFDFFTESMVNFLEMFGLQAHKITLQIFLPVGISFYTFRSISYTMNVYRGMMKPAKNYTDYALFVAFFPELIAGPIERANNFLPQAMNDRIVTLEKVKRGAALIGWGLFKKIIIADNLAPVVSAIFSQTDHVNGAHAFLGIYAFAIQIYSDFSGYSDIARGLGKMMGFDLMLNFNLPYFSKNPQEFWRRWHISLSSWLRDYLYIPLGGNRKGDLHTYLNLMITMALGGLWHGASWTFVAWGVFLGAWLSVHRMVKPAMARLINPVSGPGRLSWAFTRTVVTFNLVCISWLFFKSQTLHQSFVFMGAIFTGWRWDPQAAEYFRQFCFYTSGLFIVQLFQYWKNDLGYIYKSPVPLKITVLAFLASVAVISFCVGLPAPMEFIYFKF